MNNDKDSASRLERFHELSNLDAIELRNRYEDDLKKWLHLFVTAELPGSALPSIDSADDWVEVIDQLARNKRAWSQRLGSLVLELCDSQTAQEEAQAKDRLTEFEEQCPWKYLRASAKNKL